MKLNKLALVASLVAACVMAFGISACKKGTLGMETLTEASGVRVECENAREDNEATSTGAIVVNKGDHITISPFLDKGSLHLTITSSSGKTVAYDDDVSGKVLFTIEAKPGQYDVKVSGKDATGWMTVFAESDEKAAEISESFEEAKKKAEESADKANEEAKDIIDEANKLSGEIAEDVKNETESAKK